MKKHIIEAIKNYRNFLSDEGIQGKLQTNLIKGLENIFIKKSKKDLLDNPFDYRSLFNENSHNMAVRISNCLKGQGIETYNDLAKNCYENYARHSHRSWGNDETAYFNYLSDMIRNIGNKSADAIISHLKSINFNFSKKYAKEVFEKSESS